MALFLGYFSALEFLRKPDNPNRLKPSKARPQAVRPPGRVQVDSLKENFPFLGDPLHLLVASEASKRKYLGVCHVWADAMPEKSFVSCPWHKGLYVASPEACFLQLASTLSLEHLVMVGFELCGTYAISSEDRRGFVDRSPLTSVQALNRYLDKASGAKGIKRARQALRYVVDGSASPAETKLCMLLCFPTVLGGFGIPRPLMNQRIEIAKTSRDLTPRQFFKCDLYWPQIRTAIEYDSELAHSSPEQVARDASRRNALEAMGFRMITVTKGQLYDARELERVALVLSRRFGRWHKSECAQVLTKRRALRQVVLSVVDPADRLKKSCRDKADI